MPANLTPQYKEAEQRFRRATSHDEKLETLREMLALLPKHKGTEKIQADLRHRVAKLEEEGEHARRAGPQRFDPGHVRREGAGQWVLIGPPNSGKSALVRALTHAHPEVAAYPFTTRVPLPGMMPFEDVQVQLVDTPAVAPHHTEPYLANLVHSADGILLVLDVTSDDVEESLHELLSVMERARVWPEGRPLPPDAPPFLLVKPVIAIGNKRDLDPDETFAVLARGSIPPGITFHSVSAEHGAGLEDLRPTLFERLACIRIYAKEPGKKPDLEKPFVLKRGATVRALALAVHKELGERVKYARIWGTARFDGQQVDRDHVLSDRDVAELHS
ncbi:MAG: TGS domain-containing protein [Candidatus Eisenbacteria bacterium]|uniref:TGS domain-containing protein n=1 Tax=Eiseniibacteriota bacterium TaxID=2212470 RepID=A0A538SSY4_UNCEI|nr:MAG: TGS domain-containing protein [Candidatus Eisenbacteria bacterium]